MFLTLILTIGYPVGEGYKWSEKPAVAKPAKGDLTFSLTCFMHIHAFIYFCCFVFFTANRCTMHFQQVFWFLRYSCNPFFFFFFSCYSAFCHCRFQQGGEEVSIPSKTPSVRKRCQCLRIKFLSLPQGLGGLWAETAVSVVVTDSVCDFPKHLCIVQ